MSDMRKLITPSLLATGLMGLVILEATAADPGLARAEALNRAANPYSLLGLRYSARVDYEELLEAGAAEKPGNFGVDPLDPAGLHFDGGRNMWQSAHRYRLSSPWGGLTRPRAHSGFYGDLSYAYDAQNQFSLFAQYARLRYPFAMQQMPSDSGVVGAGWLRALDSSGKPLFLASLFVGDERDPDRRVHGDKELYGLRLAGQTRLTDKTDLFAAFRAQYGRYSIPNMLFQTTREDSQYDLSLGLNWRFAPNWSLRPQLSYTKNQSNIVTYEYDRTDFSVTVRRDFR